MQLSIDYVVLDDKIQKWSLGKKTLDSQLIATANEFYINSFSYFIESQQSKVTHDYFYEALAYQTLKQVYPEIIKDTAIAFKLFELYGGNNGEKNNRR